MAELKVTEEVEKECLDAFFCPITRELMVNPVTLITDGHTYEMAAILQWFETGRRISPLTGKRVQSTNTTPNHAIKKAISEFIKKYPEHKKESMDKKTLLKIIELREKDLLLSINKHNVNNTSNTNDTYIDIDNIHKSVIEFLSAIHQSKYIETFASNEIYSMDIVQCLTENDLKEMIDKIGPRRIIYNAIQKLNEKQSSIATDEKKEMDDKDIAIVSRCRVCDKTGNKKEFRMIGNDLCCDDCYKYCTKHNEPCLMNSGELSFGSHCWYCYKCMIQCSCGTWWRPNEMNYHPKGSGFKVKCIMCQSIVKM